MTQCYTNVQKHCSDIEKKMSGAGGIIDVKLAAEVSVSLEAVLDLVVTLVADIQADVNVGLSIGDLQDCGPTFTLIVKLLTDILIKISNACRGGKSFFHDSRPPSLDLKLPY